MSEKFVLCLDFSAFRMVADTHCLRRNVISVHTLCSVRRTGRMNDFAKERLEIIEENKNRAYVVYTAADQFHPLSNEINAINMGSYMNMTREIRFLHFILAICFPSP